MISSTCRKLRCLSVCHKILHHSLLSWDITFWRILQFDWLTVFSPINREPEFCQIKDWWWNINNNINFHFELFTRKTINKIFQKIEKPYFGAILDPFCKDLGKNEFSWKKRLCQFLNILIIYHHTKNQKKKFAIPEENVELTDGQTGRRTRVIDRQMDRGPINYWPSVQLIFDHLEENKEQKTTGTKKKNGWDSKRDHTHVKKMGHQKPWSDHFILMTRSFIWIIFNTFVAGSKIKISNKTKNLL